MQSGLRVQKFISHRYLALGMLLCAGLFAPFAHTHAALTDGLVGFWSLNEASGTRADSIGSNNLAATGGSVTGVAGKIATSSQFQNGSSGYLSVADNSTFNMGGGDFTLSAWVYLDNRTGTQVFAAKYGSGGYALYYESLSSAFIFSTYAGGGITTGSALGNPSTGTWYHLVGVHDSVANTNTLRINDQYENVSTSVVDQGDNSGPFTVGAFGSLGQYVANGRVDAVGLWNRTLTGSEITALYAGGSGVELTADSTAPSLSALDSGTPGSSSATLTWTTDESASSRIVYGPTNAYGTTTPTRDTSPRVTSHTVTLSGLIACTTYHYAAVSTDGSSNTATSTDATFTTTGCQGDATPSISNTASITSSVGGSVELTESGKTFTVTAPANATATSSSFAIQVKAMRSDTALASIGRPSTSLSTVGTSVFDVKAIINGTTVLDSFASEITIRYQYQEDEISAIDEDSLWLYHYSDGVWQRLNSCTVDTSVRTISCTTPSFSVFGLFGNAKRHKPASIMHYGCKDPRATNYEYFAASKPELCTYTTASGVTTTSVRDLKKGMQGSDVRALQTLLIAQKVGPHSSALARMGASGYFGAYTQSALAEYQRTQGITPSSGYFGTRTRAHLSARSVEGLWW